MQAARPFVEFGTLVGGREIVAVIDNDRYGGELAEHLHRHLHAFGLARQGAHLPFGRHLPRGERHVAARLKGNNRPYIVRSGQREPAYTAALRVRDEDSGSDSVEQRGVRIGVERQVGRADVGCHLPEELVERLLAAVELHAVEIVGIDTEAETVEPYLLVELRGERDALGAAPRIAPSGLVNEVGGIASAEKDVLEPLASVGRGLPCLGELPHAVRKDHRQRAGMDGFLIEDIRVVAVVGMPRGVAQDGAAYGETALFSDMQGVLAGARHTDEKNCKQDRTFHRARELFLYFGFLQGVVAAADDGNGGDGILQLPHFFGGESDVRGTEIFLQVRQFGGAGDRYDKGCFVHQPRQCHLCGRDTARPAEGVEHLHYTGVGAYGVGLEAGQRLPVVVVGVEAGVFVNHSAEETAVERAVRYKADTEFPAHGQHLALNDAVHQVVLALDGGEGADTEGAANGFGIDFAQPPMENLALPNEFGAGLRHYLDGRVRVDTVLIEDTEYLHPEVAERVLAHAPDVVGRAVFLGLYLYAVDELMPEFGRDKHAVGVAAQCLSDKLLVDVVAVTLGGVEERNTALHGFVHEGYLLLAVGVLAAVVVEPHTAIAHSGDGEGGSTRAEGALRADGCHTCGDSWDCGAVSRQGAFRGGNFVQRGFDTYRGTCGCGYFQEVSAVHTISFLISAAKVRHFRDIDATPIAGKIT